MNLNDGKYVPASGKVIGLPYDITMIANDCGFTPAETQGLDDLT